MQQRQHCLFQHRLDHWRPGPTWLLRFSFDDDYVKATWETGRAYGYLRLRETSGSHFGDSSEIWIPSFYRCIRNGTLWLFLFSLFLSSPPTSALKNPILICHYRLSADNVLSASQCMSGQSLDWKCLLSRKVCESLGSASIQPKHSCPASAVSLRQKGVVFSRNLMGVWHFWN